MITQEKTPTGLPVVNIQNAFGNLTFSLYGAHILSWIPSGHEEVFYISPLSQFEAGEPIRGGIPVCWPWFGKVKNPPHGYARLNLWTLEESYEKEDGSARILLSYESSEERGLRVEMEIIFGKELTQRLTTYAGENPVTIAEALHTYYLVGDIRHIKVTGLESVPFAERAEKNSAVTESPLQLQNSLDRIYDPVTGEVAIIDDSLKRKITIKREGSNSVIVWNPWEGLSKGMSDLPDDGWHSFICVESGNVESQSVAIEPKGMHSLTQTIRVDKIS